MSGTTHIVAETATREECSRLWDGGGSPNSSHAVVDFSHYVPQSNISLAMDKTRGNQVGIYGRRARRWSSIFVYQGRDHCRPHHHHQSQISQRLREHQE